MPLLTSLWPLASSRSTSWSSTRACPITPSVAVRAVPTFSACSRRLWPIAGSTRQLLHQSISHTIPEIPLSSLALRLSFPLLSSLPSSLDPRLSKTLPVNLYLPSPTPVDSWFRNARRRQLLLFLLLVAQIHWWHPGRPCQCPTARAAFLYNHNPSRMLQRKSSPSRPYLSHSTHNRL